MALEDFAAPDACELYYDPAAGAWRYDLWPDNWPAIRLFLSVSTQWRVGMNGPVGLDYNVVFHELDRMGLERDEYDDLMGAIREIERTALDELRKE